MLWKKMLRDIWQNKGSYAACLVVAVVGLLTFTSFSILQNNMEISQETLYNEQRFADAFAYVESMPRGRVQDLEKVEGVERAQGRLTRQVRLFDPDRDESVFLELVGMDFAEPLLLNDVLVLEGNHIEPGHLEVLVDNQFFAANRLDLRDELPIVAAGRVQTLTVNGTGMSPEFVYPLRTETEIYPDPETFGIVYISLEDMYRIFPEEQGQVDDLVFTLEAGAKFEDVRHRLEPALERYGLITAYPREEQVSHFILREEIEQIERMATALPLIFLGVAAIILYIMLMRIVEQQRGQIGILKAFGYTDGEVMIHYLSYALLIGTVAGILGTGSGIIAATPLTTFMLEFFNLIPVYEGFSLAYMLSGLAMSLGVFLFAGYQGCKGVLRLNPVEAMRPPTPGAVRRTLAERWGFFWNMLTIQGQMAVRNVSRNRRRSAFMFVGIMLSSALVVMVWSLNDMMDVFLFRQYQQVETYDARITLSRPAHRQPVLRELESRPEVVRAEPLAEVPVTLSHRWHSKDVLALGIDPQGGYYNIIDDQDRRIPPPEQGVILSQRLADILDVRPGSAVEIESPYLPPGETRSVRVVDTVPQYLGMHAYLSLPALDHLLDQGKLATSVLVGLDHRAGSNLVPELRDHFQESPMVAGVDGRWERIEQSEELLEAMGGLIYLYLLLGMVIGFAIIYSSSFIILSERSRELASMQVLGMTPEEVFSVITFEQWFLGLGAMAMGIPLAALIQLSFAEAMSTDLYAIPSHLSREAIPLGLALTAAAIWIAQRFALRKVRQLSLVEVLKSRE